MAKTPVQTTVEEAIEVVLSVSKVHKNNLEFLIPIMCQLDEYFSETVSELILVQLELFKNSKKI